MLIDPESIQVWVVCLAGHTAESWRRVLSESEWEKAMRFRMPADQKRFAVTRGVLKTLLGGYLEMPATNVAFTQNKYGKLADPSRRIEFNISHSGDFALLAFSKNSAIGVDIERIGGDRVVSDLARRVLSPREYERFMMLEEANRLRTFFQIWTLKESLLKAIGSGLSVPPEDVEITFYPDTPKLLSASVQEILDVTQWTLRSLSVGQENYAAAVAIKHKTPSIEVRHFESHRPDST